MAKICKSCKKEYFIVADVPREMSVLGYCYRCYDKWIEKVTGKELAGKELEESFKEFVKKTGFKGKEAIKKYKEDCGQKGWEAWICQQNDDLTERCLKLERTVDKLHQKDDGVSKSKVIETLHIEIDRLRKELKSAYHEVQKLKKEVKEMQTDLEFPDL